MLLIFLKLWHHVNYTHIDIGGGPNTGYGGGGGEPRGFFFPHWEPYSLIFEGWRGNNSEQAPQDGHHAH